MILLNRGCFFDRFVWGLLLCSEEKELYSVGPWGHKQKKGARLFLGIVWLKAIPQGHPLVGPQGGEHPAWQLSGQEQVSLNGNFHLLLQTGPLIILVLTHTPPLMWGEGGCN